MIVTGAGEKSFVAGADIEETSGILILFRQGFCRTRLGPDSRIEKLHVPVIAAVNGYALGGGCELAMACHLRLASEKRQSSGSRKSIWGSFPVTAARSDWRDL